MPPEIVDPTSVFNPGAVLKDDTTLLLLRVQTRGRRTYLVPARCDDPAAPEVAPRPPVLGGLDRLPYTAHHVYDPRLTMLNDRLHVVTALDTDRGGRLAVWTAAGDDAAGFGGLDRLALIATTGEDDTRNGVLFPDQVGGRWLMLERPNRKTPAGGPPTGSEITLSASDDLVAWEPLGPVMGGRPHFWDELIGAGPPPVATDQGWLLIYHGVATHFGAANVYQAGCVLLDRDDPRRVLARCRDNILEPRAPWELTGQVPNVVFPSGLTVATDGTARIYYGAADTCVGLHETSLAALVAACAEA
jgi:beta-1,4-mannooligosaccharide/beta-1,4-mannosyl-N-acetylglucosamine phosphorylase